MSARTPPEEILPARSQPLVLPRLSSNVKFFSAAIFIYASAIIVATLALNPYFAQTWDVQTFIHAAREITDGNPFDLYAQSRAAQTWPYAYPPLHALVVALALFIGDALRAPIGVPDFVWARVPPLVADISVAFALYEIVRRKSGEAMLGRAAFLLWLFNPLTFYDTAAQGHFEAEWIFFVLLAYARSESGRGLILPAIALAMAVLFKQVAILFAVPVWLTLSLRGAVFAPKQSPSSSSTEIASHKPLAMTRVLLSILIFALITGAVSLPFLLYSGDYVFMNTTYVEQVPVQTQSWLVGILGLTRAAPDALTTDFFLIRDSTMITLAAAAIISFIAARRGWSLFLTGALIALAFFLLSRKVMGYYYVMLLPFLLAEFLPRRRFDLFLIAMIASAFIALSPYYAAWTDHAHWWAYALLGVVTSMFFAWLLWQTADSRPLNAADGSRITNYELRITNSSNPRPVVWASLSLFAAAFFAAMLQPLLNSAASPIRAPIVAPGTENIATVAFGALIALTLGASALIARGTRAGSAMPRAAFVIPLLFAPLAFAVFTLTKETTAIFEMVLKALGV